MNRVYRLVWNPSLNVLQAAPENARAQGGASGNFSARALRRNPLALAIATVVLASMSVPAWSQVCTPTSPSGCGAPGGTSVRPGRINNGASGNGTGGDASSLDASGTSEIAGSTADGNGNGGAGATSVDSIHSITATGGAGGSVGAIGSAGASTSVTGGAGQPGQTAPAGGLFGGGGGGGGAGIFINDGNSTPTVSAATVITGGAAGAGGDQNAATNGDGGSGGGGGAGIIVGTSAGGVSLINNGRIVGGAGGSGGNNGYAGSGGGGGDGMLALGAGTAITNGAGGTITGGAGGAPGQFTNGSGEPAGNGGGGAGVNLVGAGSSLTNAGTITGGATGSGGNGFGGVGVRAWGGETVTTGGSIQGALNGDGTQANAVLFSGGGNALTIDPGATFTGNIQSLSGTTNGGDTLTLGGAGAGTLNSGLIVGFANNVKAGDSTWTLTGTGNGGINWTVEQGQLIGSSSTFAGNLTFASSGSGTAPSVEFDQAAAGSFTGSVSGAGSLIKAGAGTLGLSGDLSTFTGQLAINAGGVAITGAGTMSGTDVTGVAATTFDVSGISGGSATLAGLSGSGNVTLGTHTLALNNPNNESFGGVISSTGGGLTLNGGTETFTGVNTYTGDTTIDAGSTLKLTGGGRAGSQSRAVVAGTFDLSGLTAGTTLPLHSLSGAGTVTLGANNLLLTAAADTFGGVIGGTGGLAIVGGTETLTGVNTYSGITNISAGSTLKLTGAAQIGQGQSLALVSGTLDLSGLTGGSTLGMRSLTSAGTVTLGANTLELSNAGNTFGGVIGGTGGGITLDGGTQTLSGHNTYTGTTLINGGTLSFGINGTIAASSVQMTGGTFDISGAGTGNSLSVVSLAGNAGNVNLGGAGLTLSDAAGTYGGVIGGAGTLNVNAGSEVLNGANTYTGLTTVAANSTLFVGDSTHTTAKVAGAVSVNGGTLGGFGTVGNTIVSNSGTLAAGGAGQIGTLTVNGDLTIGNGSKLNFDFGAPGPNFSTPGQSDHIVVTGGLSIGTSTLNVTNLGSMGPGLYNLFQWGTSLSITGGGFAPPSGMSLQVLSIDKQINLIDTQGFTLNEWDANGQASAGSMGGGSGTWSTFSNTWADTSGQFVGPMSPQPAFAIFGGAAGTVTVDDSNGAVSATGMQFMTDGYHLTGDALTLVGQGGVAPVVRVSSGATAVVDNVLAGTDGLNKTDGGTLVLNGNNTYQGTTTLSGGFLSVASDANLGASANPLEFQGGTLKVTGTGFNQTARNIVWGSAGGGFDIDDATNTFTVAQALTGTGGLLKSGAGTLLLNGQNTYTGGTILNAGTLEVGDADHASATLAGDLQVNATGTLRGHGTVAGNIANNGGTVSPGGSIGTLNVGGNYTQASNGTLAVEVSPTAASLLNVGGTATLNGVLAITYDPGTYTAKQYTLVSAKGISGQFSSVTNTMASGALLGSLQQNVTYSGNAVGLALADAAVVGPGNPTTPVTPVVVAPTGISIYTALGSSVSIGSQAANTALLARLNHVSSATAAAPDGWIDATGAQTHVGGTSGEPGYQANRYGFLAGLDRKFGDYTLGVAGGYTHTDVNEQQTGDSGTADTLRVALYGSRWFGPVGVSATAGYALDFLSQKRPFGPLGTAEGDHIGNEFTAGGQASMPMTFGSIVVTPSMGLRYAYFRANGFGESGAGGQDLGVGTDNVRSLQPYAEVTVDKAFGDALRPVNLQVRLGYAQELMSSSRAVSVTAQDGTLFAAPGTSLPRGYLTAGVSLSMQPTKAMTVSVGYDTLINTTHASAQAASLKFGYQF
ncbi:autotransporter-associated beta strand repeat-containing protein [Paraburkholderia flava]|uniref:autotransporter-associated beta strand repeat-containing protein n=1 Tax=Paraburkholderia flava TaxID=2547393 RepID=UPI00105F8ED0|nr:autotransporter-associated beta strand repeat-containing protein [Paraburkholderia flava]